MVCLSLACETAFVKSKQQFLRQLGQGVVKNVRDEVVSSPMDFSEIAVLSQFFDENERFAHRRLTAC